MDLKDRKILITGANGGLGRAMAVSLAEHGAMLALCERTQALAAAAKAALPEPVRAQAHAFAADLTDADDLAAMVSESAATLQGLDGLVNNAAILTDDDTDPVATSLDSWRATLEVNRAVSTRITSITLAEARRALAAEMALIWAKGRIDAAFGDGCTHRLW